MKRHFAIVLDRIGQIEPVTAQLCELTQRGNTVDLLIRAKPRKRFLLEAFLAGMTIHTAGALERWERQCDLEIVHAKQLTERKVEPVRQAFAEAGFDIRIRVYAGSLEKALEELMKTHGAPLEVIRLSKDWHLLHLVKRRLKKLAVIEQMKTKENSLRFRHSTLGG